MQGDGSRRSTQGHRTNSVSDSSLPWKTIGVFWGMQVHATETIIIQRSHHYGSWRGVNWSFFFLYWWWACCNSGRHLPCQLRHTLVFHRCIHLRVDPWSHEIRQLRKDRSLATKPLYTTAGYLRSCSTQNSSFLVTLVQNVELQFSCSGWSRSTETCGSIRTPSRN